MAPRLLRRRLVVVAFWKNGKNFGDDYLGHAMASYIRSRYRNFAVVKTNLDVDGQELSCSDFLIISGGGMWGPSGSGRLAKGLYDAWTGTQAKLIIANIGIESFDPSAAEDMRMLRRKAAIFSVRDQESWAIAKSVLGESAVLWTADTTFLNPMLVQRSPQAKSIAVNLCGPEQESNYKPYPVQALVDAVRELSRCGWVVRGSVFSYKNRQSDLRYCRQFDPGALDAFCAETFERCEVFIGMHFHSVILALQNEIPVVAINYSDKVRRLMREYRLEDYCLEPEDAAEPGKLQSVVENLPRTGCVEKIRAGNAAAITRLAAFERGLAAILQET